MTYIGHTNREIPVTNDVEVGSKVRGPFGTVFNVTKVEELPDSTFKGLRFENLKLTMERESDWPNNQAEIWWTKPDRRTYVALITSDVLDSVDHNWAD